MPGYTKVALAGATGNLGPTLVQELVAAGLTVTALTRSTTIPNIPSGVRVVQVDYSSPASLAKALEGQEVFISNLPQHDQQEPLIDAAIAAGVKLFIPSEFGSNVIGNAKTAALPVFGGKLSTQKYLKAREKEIDWTVVCNGGFLDWGVRVGFLVNLQPDGETALFNGGDVPFSTTLLSDVGKAVAGVILHPEETKNRAVYVQSVSTTQNQLLDIAEKVRPGYKRHVKNWTTQERLDESFAQLKRGGKEIMPAMIGFIHVSLFDKDYDLNFAGKNDNKLLGIKELSEAELEKVVAEIKPESLW